MSLPRFNGAERISGGAMPFESYLKQIHYLHPSLPDLYVKYLTMINEFDAKQLERLLKAEEHELSDVLLSTILLALQHAKEHNYDSFMLFVETYGYQDIVAELFEVGGSLEAMLQKVKEMYPEFIEEYEANMMLVINFYKNESDRFLLLPDDEFTIALNDYRESINLELIYAYLLNTLASGRETIVEVDMGNGQMTPFPMPVVTNEVENILAILTNLFSDVIVPNPNLHNDYNLLIPNAIFNAGLNSMELLKDTAPDYIEMIKESPQNIVARLIELFGITGGGELENTIIIDTSPIHRDIQSTDSLFETLAYVNLEEQADIIGGLTIQWHPAVFGTTHADKLLRTINADMMFRLAVPDIGSMQLGHIRHSGIHDGTVETVTSTFTFALKDVPPLNNTPIFTTIECRTEYPEGGAITLYNGHLWLKGKGLTLIPRGNDM